METYFIYDKNNLKNDYKELEHRLSNFSRINSSKNADFIVSYGGDGTLLDCFHDNPYKKIYPIRDYKLCERHKQIFNLIYTYSEFDVLNFNLNNKKLNALAEIVIRNKNLSTAMRCNLYINNNLYAKNIIGDGLIFSTSLGSTGYFKNVTNTFFTTKLARKISAFKLKYELFILVFQYTV